MSSKIFATAVAAVGIALAVCQPTLAVLSFGLTDTFETQSAGTQPSDWFDADTGWFGQALVVASGTDGVPASGFGGSHFVKVTPDAVDTYIGGGGARESAFARTGQSTAFPTTTDAYAVFRDVYFQSESTGAFWMQNTVRNANTGLYLTESSFRFTTGASTWNVVAALGSSTGVDLGTNTWYTLEEVWDRSGSSVQITYNIYNVGTRETAAPIFSETVPDYLGVASSDLGGSGAHSWFTVWDNSGIPAAVYVDNMGTAAVPEVGSVVMCSVASLVGLGLAYFQKRSRAAVATSQQSA